MSFPRLSLLVSLLLALPAARALADPPPVSCPNLQSSGTFTGSVDPPEVTYPKLPTSAATVEGFVPTGWAIECRADGDLNGGGAQDVALVLRDQDPKNVLGSDNSPEPNGFDTNPRLLALLFKQKNGGYRLANENHALIPRADNPSADDYLDEGGGIGIAKGKLTLAMRLFMSAGGWTMGTIHYVFRYQNGAFVMIGYDSDMTQRNSGEETADSVDYLTGKEKITESKISDDGPGKVRWKTLASHKLLTLDEVGDGMAFSP